MEVEFSISSIETLIIHYLSKHEMNMEVGITGSLARNDFTDNSDVDILLKIDSKLHSNKQILSWCKDVEDAIYKIFSRETDFIDYNVVLSNINKICQNQNEMFFKNLYKQMLKDTIWIKR